MARSTLLTVKKENFILILMDFVTHILLLLSSHNVGALEDVDRKYNVAIGIRNWPELAISSSFL